VCQNLAHLIPRTTPWQRCTYCRLTVRPAPAEVRRRTDYFGNAVQDFSIHKRHRSLRVSAASKVDVTARAPIVADAGLAWDVLCETVRRCATRSDLDAYQFCFPSRHVCLADELADYARPSFPPGRPLWDAVTELNARVHADFTYDPQATELETPCLDVFRQRRGVCQDLAHVLIGCLRSLGLPARYVSGYLRTESPPGKPRLVGADASHAWLAVYGGGAAGWRDLDPTNNVIPSVDHITVAWGRDYADVAPIRGVFVGGGQHRISVSVDVTPLDAPRAA
jgi:transglutaminase-like putative cysteine protease